MPFPLLCTTQLKFKGGVLRDVSQTGHPRLTAPNSNFGRYRGDPRRFPTRVYPENLFGRVAIDLHPCVSPSVERLVAKNVIQNFLVPPK